MQSGLQDPYDVLIIGGGASGSALLYTLAEYSTVGKIALVEKYARPGQVNSKASNNSQTLHVGDIETNYGIEKVRQVYPASMMIAQYGQSLPEKTRNSFLFPMPKMVLGVGIKEVAILEQRFDALKTVFPNLKKLNRKELQTIEPAVIYGRDTGEEILALYTTEGHAVDFEKLAAQFVAHAQTLRPDIDTYFSQPVEKITKEGEFYKIQIKNGRALFARSIVVNADSYSLLLAQQLGYGKEFSLIPIAGSFYFSEKILNGKVYTVQDPKLPFAAVHGDPDINSSDHATRWGPTARFHPVLEARNMKTTIDFIRSSGLQRFSTWASFAKILLDPTRFKYLLTNMLYELPYIGKLMFIKNVRKIVPTIKPSDVTYAKGYGGMRLQRVDTRTKELLLGEGKIMGDNAIFNMTPSPGASVSLYNAMRDAETVISFLGGGSNFEKSRMMRELYINLDSTPCSMEDVSQAATYVS